MAEIDPRIKAVATVSMYDTGAANRDGLGHSVTPEQRQEVLERAAEQRDVEFAGGETECTSGTPEQLTENSTPVEREFFASLRGCIECGAQAPVIGYGSASGRRLGGTWRLEVRCTALNGVELYRIVVGLLGFRCSASLVGWAGGKGDGAKRPLIGT